jgi:choline-glycine betaine transporter
MTIRSCFYPLVGERIFGYFGDMIDVFSVVSTMFGVCTSLGFGVMSLNAGLNRLNSNITESTTNQIFIIWGVTIVATISVISGLKVGIRRLSELCFCLGMFLMLFVFFHDDTWFLLNLHVQRLGYYLHSLLQIGFHTEAFAQLGNAPDGHEAQQWMDGWTIFYWGWWTAFCPFVGMFIAKISRGRTIKNFLNATLTAPVLYIFMWFCIFGGAGLKMERDAVLAGVNCSVSPYVEVENHKLYKLSCRNNTQQFFDLLQQYGDNLGYVLNVITVIGIVLYFVTSSDSGSLVIDCLSANGNPEPPVGQRIFWALTEGACATALLKAGGSTALTALQTVSIASGLPYLAILLFMCVSIWRCVKEEAGDIDPNAATFDASLSDVFDNPSFPGLNRFIVAVVAPWLPAGRAAGKLYNKSSWSYMLVMAVLFYGWIFFEILQVVDSGFAYVGWVVLCGFFAYVVGIRSSIREESKIPGSMIFDTLVVAFLYFLAVDQMDKHMHIGERQKKEDPDFPLDNKKADIIMENGDAKANESTTFV